MQNLDPLTNGSYWGPVGESPTDYLLDKTFLASSYLSGMGFGAQFIVYLSCMQILWRKKPRRYLTNFLMMYTTMLCIMNILFTGMTYLGAQLAYVNNRNFPGGVLAFIGASEVLPTNVLSITTLVLINNMCDGLLWWRCRLIWSISTSTLIANCVMLFPALMLAASLGMGIFFDIRTAAPAGLYGDQTAKIGLAYFTISLSLNIILTLMISYRILRYQRVIRRSLGDEYSKTYTTITSMFVESAAIYSVLSIALLVTFALNSPLNQIWLGLAPGVQSITSYLIILRVADGRAWSSAALSKSAPQSTLIFRNAKRGQSTAVTSKDDYTHDAVVVHRFEMNSSFLDKPPGVQTVDTAQTGSTGTGEHLRQYHEV